MSSARDHHAKAEELLEQAHAEQDGFRRSRILAEAQLHAILALSAPAEASPPGPAEPSEVPPDNPDIILNIADPE